jgi:hypothetical protein
LIDLFERQLQFPLFRRQFLATSHNPLLLRFLSEETRGDALLIYRLASGTSSQAIRIVDIPGMRDTLSRQDLGHLFSTGFLEDAVELLAPEPPESGPSGRPLSRGSGFLSFRVLIIPEDFRNERIREIVDRYRSMIDYFLLTVDRDGQPGRRQRLKEIEAWAEDYLSDAKALFATAALQEAEIWALAGMKDLPTEWRWKDMRAEPHCKEVDFETYARQRGLSAAPFGGRKLIGLEAARNFGRIRDLCDEDLGELERRLEVWLQKQG